MFTGRFFHSEIGIPLNYSFVAERILLKRRQRLDFSRQRVYNEVEKYNITTLKQG